MLLKKLLIVSNVLLVLASCAKPIEPKTIVKTEFIKPNIQVQPRPRPVALRDVNFYVVNAANYEEFKTRFTKENGEFVFVAISVEGYENLSLNLADLKRYLDQQKEIIVFYEKSVK